MMQEQMSSSSRTTRKEIMLDEWSRLKKLRKSGDIQSLLVELQNPKIGITAGGSADDPDYITVRQKAAVELGKLGDPNAIDPVSKLLSDSIPIVRMYAARALGKFKQDEAVPALVTALHDESPKVRWTAAASLKSIGSREATPALISTLRDDEPWVRVSAARALARLGDRTAIEPLKNAVKREGISNINFRLRLQRSLLGLRFRALLVP